MLADMHMPTLSTHLHHFAKVNALHQVVDVLVVVVVREYQQRTLDVPRLGQTDDQMPQVGDARVHLHHNDHRVVLQRPELVLVQHHLQLVVVPDGALHLAAVGRVVRLDETVLVGAVRDDWACVRECAMPFSACARNGQLTAEYIPLTMVSLRVRAFKYLCRNTGTIE